MHWNVAMLSYEFMTKTSMMQAAILRLPSPGQLMPKIHFKTTLGTAQINWYLVRMSIYQVYSRMRCQPLNHSANVTQ